MELFFVLGRQTLSPGPSRHAAGYGCCTSFGLTECRKAEARFGYLSPAGPQKAATPPPQRLGMTAAVESARRTGESMTELQKKLPAKAGITGQRKLRLQQLAELYKPPTGEPTKTAAPEAHPRAVLHPPAVTKAGRLPLTPPEGGASASYKAQRREPSALAPRAGEEVRKRYEVRARKRQEEEDLKKQEAEARKRKEEEQQQEEARKKADEEARKKAEEEARKKKEEENLRAKLKQSIVRKGSLEAQRREAKKAQEVQSRQAGLSGPELLKEAEEIFKRVDDAARSEGSASPCRSILAWQNENLLSYCKGSRFA